jgi:hypothetical protein
MGDQTQRPGPDELGHVKGAAVPDETDTAGHMLGIPDEVGPDEGGGHWSGVVPEPDENET